MKILLKLLTFVLCTFVLGVREKCQSFNGESRNSCDEHELSQEYKTGRDTVTNCECGYDGNEHKTCCFPSEFNRQPTHKSILNRIKDLEDMRSLRCTETTPNSIYCYLTQQVIPEPSSTAEINTELQYSEQCSLTNLKLGEIKSDETPNAMNHCCGIESSSGNRIYGGTETAIDEYPWLAKLEYQRLFLCGGTLISSFYVLTAAHCLVTEIMKPRGVKSVRLGEYNTTTDGEDCVDAEGGGLDCTDGAVSINISKIIVHPEYNKDFIRPICLPSSDVTKLNKYLQFRFHVAGWGEVSNYQLRSDVKLQVEVPIIDQKVCEELYSSNGNPIIWDKQFCAGGEPNKDTCKGDSGGPLIYSDDDSKHQIIGITSFGVLRCGIEGRPSIYTKVIEYVPWIMANMKSFTS